MQADAGALTCSEMVCDLQNSRLLLSNDLETNLTSEQMSQMPGDARRPSTSSILFYLTWLALIRSYKMYV